MSGLRRFSYGMICLLVALSVTSAKADDILKSLTESLVLGILNHQDPGLTDEELRNLAEERAIALIENAQSRPKTVRHVAIPDSIISLVNKPLLNYVEEVVELEGHLTTTYFEYDDLSGAHHFTLQPENGSDTVFLHFDGPPPGALIGSFVRVRGILLPKLDETTDDSARHMVVGSDGDSVEALSEAGVITAPPSVGRQRTGIFLARFSNDPARPTNLAYAREWAFAQLDRILRKHSLSGAWLSQTGIERLELATAQTCDRKLIQQELFQSLALSGRDFTAYDRIFLILPSLKCNWRATTVFPGSPNVILVNEKPTTKGLFGALLHGLGMPSHQIPSCDFDIMHSECQTQMGSGLSQSSIVGVLSISPYHKESVNWMSVGGDGRISTVDEGGMHRVGAADTMRRPLALKIERPAPLLQRDTTYYVEYRVRKVHGKRLPPEVVVYIVSGDGIAETLNLTSPKPVQDKLQDAISLSEGRFIDHAAGLEIEVAEMKQWRADLDISFDPATCVRAAPEVEVAPLDTPYLSPGSSIEFSVAVSNRDSSDCEPLRTNLQLQVPNGWNVQQDPEIPELQPGQTVETDVSVTIPSNEGPGFRQLQWVVQGDAPMPARRASMVFVMPSTGGGDGDDEEPAGDPNLHRVSEYGAKCTGSSDDTAALQRALNELGSGDTLLFDKGLCGVGRAGLTLSDKSNITIRGRGRGTGFKALAKPGTHAGLTQFGWGPTMVAVWRCDKCTFRDLEFDANFQSTGGMIWFGVSNSLLDNNYFHWGKASSGYTSHKTATLFGVATSNGEERVDFGGKNNIYRHNEFDRSCCPGRREQRGIFIFDDSNSIIERNTFRRLSHTAIAPLNSPGSIVRHNAALGGFYGGIKAAALDRDYKVLSGTETRTYIHDNVIVSNYNNGINLSHISNVEVTNNIALGNWTGLSFTGLRNSNILVEKNTFCARYRNVNEAADPFDPSKTMQKINVIVRNNELYRHRDSKCTRADQRPLVVDEVLGNFNVALPLGAGNYPVGNPPSVSSTGGPS